MENIFCEKHLIGLGWTSLLIIILLFISKKYEKKYGVKRILQIGTLIFLSLEVIKFIHLDINNDISMFYFPIQFCSLMLYAYPIIAFGKGKIVRVFLPFAYVIGLLAGLLALILPTNILGDPNVGWLDKDNFMYTLSFIYHSFMIFYSLYLIISNYYIPKVKDIFGVVIISSIFAFIAQILNIIYDQDFMMLNRGKGNPLAFVMEYHYTYYIIAQLLLLIILSFITIFITAKIKKRV